MPEWIKPTRRELIIQGVILVAMAAGNALLAFLAGIPGYQVMLGALGTLVLVLAAIAIGQWLWSPFRSRHMTAADLEQSITRWLRAAGYGIAPPPSMSYRLAVGAMWAGGTTVWIVQQTEDDPISVGTQKIDQNGAIRALLEDGKWWDMIFDLLLEVGGYGAYIDVTENPLTLTFQEIIPTRDGIQERDLVGKVEFVRRAEALASLVVTKHTAKDYFDRTATFGQMKSSMQAPKNSEELLERLRQSRAQAQAQGQPPITPTQQ